MSKLSEELQWRGLIKDSTFKDIGWLDEPKKFYLGVDVGSADSLTIGNLAVLLLARRLLDAGWETVLLVGGATSLIGDPGGKDTERELVSREQVEHNKAAIKTQVEQLFAGKQFTLVDNYDWFKDIGYLEFLRDVGKHFSLTELIQRDFIADRIGEDASGISYAEFSYSLIQGYDFWHLFKRLGVVLQIGGSDQWGNMLSGLPLIRKKELAEAHALSMPLVVDKLTGRKFGKSEGGAIWLDPTKTSPYKFYQFWLNIDDQSAKDYLKIYTLVSRQEIDELMTEFGSNPAARVAQKRLAYEVTALVHGRAEAEKQVKLAESVFGGGSIVDLSAEDLKLLESEMPFLAATDQEPAVVDVLVAVGLVSSKSEARRLMEGAAIYVNNQKFAKESLSKDQFVNGYALIRRGKSLKDTALVREQS
jgi:tyrosyl-tRNA synthetase